MKKENPPGGWSKRTRTDRTTEARQGLVPVSDCHVCQDAFLVLTPSIPAQNKPDEYFIIINRRVLLACPGSVTLIFKLKIT